MRFLSLGAGVQSSTILFMMIHGEIEPAQFALFADVKFEPPSVYRWLEYLIETAGKKIPIYIVGNKSVKDDMTNVWKYRKPGVGSKGDGSRFGTMPLFVKNQDGTQGRLNRQCTPIYKVEPQEEKIKELMGIKSFSGVPARSITQIFGISFDERERMKLPDKKCFRYEYPLIIDGASTDSPVKWKREKAMTRDDCLRWMKEHGYPEPPRSACIACPHRNDSEWLAIKKNYPELWKEAIEFDASIRNSELNGECFVHRSMVPLDQVWFDESDTLPFGCEGGFCNN